MLISLEGNIGSGKSTLLQRLKDTHPDWIFLDEPVSIWKQVKNETGKDIIECFYEDQEKYAFSFQILAYITRLKKLLEALKTYPSSTVLVTERSIETDHYVFAKMLYDDGKISPLDWQIYQQYIQTFTDQSKVDALVYVRTSPETCQERIQVRDRNGESNICLEYLQSCHNYHENWLQPLIQTPVSSSDNNNNLNSLSMNEHQQEGFSGLATLSLNYQKKQNSQKAKLLVIDSSPDTTNHTYWNNQLTLINNFVYSKNIDPSCLSTPNTVLKNIFRTAVDERVATYV